jgi:putative endonuclease
MPLDLQLDLPFESPGVHPRVARGQISHFAGQAAELAVSRDFERRGYRLLQHRWRGRGGEIDLIFQDGDGIVFVEVKQSKTHDSALESLRPAQVRRLLAAAEEFLGFCPKGSLTPMRFDVALFDQWGQIQVVENALGAW